MSDRPVVAVGLLVVDGDRVLLVRRSKPPQAGRYTVPGGKVELGEALEVAALRELKEETGLTATVGPIVEVLDRVVKDPAGNITFHYVIIDFVAHSPKGTLRAGTDASDARFVPVSELSHYELTDGLMPVVRRAFSLITGGIEPVHRLSEFLVTTE